MQDNQDLAQLIGSRICHDLVSPVGAIGNGLELLQMIRRIDSPEMVLVQDSLDNATARIRYFRLAFGQAAQDQLVDGSEIETLLVDLSRGGRITYLWQGPDRIRRPQLRVMLLMAMCLESALPMGDQIRFSGTEKRWQVDGSGPRIVWQETRWDGLCRGLTPEVKASEVQFALLPGALSQLQRKLYVEASEVGICLSF